MKTKRATALVLLLVLVVALLTACTGPESLTTGIAGITKYGNVVLDIDKIDLFQSGIRVGDTVDIHFGKKVIKDVPVCYNYSDLDTGDTLMRFVDSEARYAISVNNGNCAAQYVIAEKTDGGWKFDENTPVEIKLNTKQAYTFYDVLYSTYRVAYAGLSDEEFCNFRRLAGDIYAGCSPISPETGRNEYCMELLEKYGIKTAVNLSDKPEEAEANGNFPGSYYSRINLLCVPMGSYKDKHFKHYVKEVLKFIAANEGPCYIHCVHGKDRTGMVRALIQGYCGMSVEDITKDYMLSFSNFYGIEEGTEMYDDISENFRAMMCEMLGVKEYSDETVQRDTEKYLRSCGLSRKTLETLRDRLS